MPKLVVRGSGKSKEQRRDNPEESLNRKGTITNAEREKEIEGGESNHRRQGIEDTESNARKIV